MKDNDKIKNSIIESIIVISIMVSYIAYGIHVLPLLILLIPLPFIVLGVRNGINTNIISIFAVTLILAIILDIPSAISITIIVAPISIALNYCILKKKTITETLLISSGVAILSFLFLIFLEGKITGISLSKQMEDSFMQIITMQIDILRESGMTNHDIIQVRDYLEYGSKVFISLMPSLLSIFSIVISYVNLMLGSYILRSMRYGISYRPRFSRFKLPNNIILGTGVMFLVYFLFNKLGLEYTNVFLANLIFLIGFIFFLQGVAVIDFLLIKLKMKLFVRILIIAMNIIFLPASSIFIIIGLIDTIFDLRKIRRSKSL